MLSKLKVSPFGLNDELQSVEMNILNDEIQNALDAINGGTYVAVSPVSWSGDWAFDGAGLVTFNCNSSFNAVATFNALGSFVAGAEFLSNVDVQSSVAFANGSTLTGTAGATITWTGDVTFKGNIFFDTGTSLAIFKNGATFNTGGSVSVSVPWAFASGAALTLAAGSTASIATTVTMSGAGHINDRMVDAADTSTTYSIADGDVFYLPGSNTNLNTYTLSNTGAARGSRMRWYAFASLANTLKQHNGTTTIAVITFSGSSGQYGWVDLVNDGLGNAATSWRIVGGQKVP